MNKSELIDKVAASADIPKAVAGRALDAVIESITGALQDGESVVLVGFGTFSVKDRAARTGRNPQTGNPIEIAAAKIKGKAAVPEVCIYFEFKLYRGNRTKKRSAENFNAFE